jgi:hypothetical protein
MLGFGGVKTLTKIVSLCQNYDQNQQKNRRMGQGRGRRLSAAAGGRKAPDFKVYFPPCWWYVAGRKTAEHRLKTEGFGAAEDWQPTLQ